MAAATLGGNGYAVCTTFRTSHVWPGLRGKHFPAVYDGWTDFCRAYYSVRLDRIIKVEWNPDA